MIFLPIVRRELRVVARRRSTYWTRTIVAGAALLLLGGVGGILSLQRAGLGAQIGPILFQGFSWAAFTTVCATGVLLTFDTMSEEKREGTLGLLFLTDLRGYDVVLGKLLASSLQAAFGLLAAFPIIGITFLVGGVTGTEFWRLAIVLCNTLFFSLAIGVSVSTISRDAQRALTCAILLLLGFVVGLPTVDSAATGWDATRFVPRLSYFSPFHGFSLASQTRPLGLALNLGLVHGLGWLMLAFASFLAPRAWQEKSNTVSGRASSGNKSRFGSSARRAALRQRWLEKNPVRWLAARDRWLGRFMWAFWGAVLLLVAAISFGPPPAQAVWNTVGPMLFYLVAFVFKLWLVSQASRFFLESTRSGVLELLLVSPLPPAQIVRGQAWALWRRFLFPTLLLIVAQTVLALMQMDFVMKNMAGGATTTGATQAGTGPALNDYLILQIISSAGSLVTFVTGLFALGWFGMWMGLTSRKINPAIFKTLVFVDILPATILIFAQGFLMFGAAFARMPMWVPSTLVIVAQIAADLVFLAVARHRLLTRLREMASRAAGAPNVAPPSPPPLPAGQVSV